MKFQVNLINFILRYKIFFLVPIVVICAPFGAFISSHLHRQVLASFVYILELCALIGFLITKPPLYLIIIGATIIIFRLLIKKLNI